MKKYITPKVIELSRRIHEAGIMGVWEPKNGDWFAVFESAGDYDFAKAQKYYPPRIYHVHNINCGRYYSYADPKTGCGVVFSENPTDYCIPKNYCPIPDPLQCLEWLLQNENDEIALSFPVNKMWDIQLHNIENPSRFLYRQNSDLWQALLEAVLAVGGGR